MARDSSDLSESSEREKQLERKPKASNLIANRWGFNTSNLRYLNADLFYLI